MSTNQKNSIAQTNHGFKTIPKSVKTISIFVLILLNCFAFRNLFILSKDMIFGDFSAQHLIPLPLYPIARIPIRSIPIKYDAENRLGKDFAQIYFPAQDISSPANAFNCRTRDPWERPSRYAPLILYICSISICQSTYGFAAFWHMIIQILVFLLISYIAFKTFDRIPYFLPFLLFANLCLFLTPTGLSWFERGQFSLYEASSYLLLLLGLWKKNLFWIFSPHFWLLSNGHPFL